MTTRHQEDLFIATSGSQLPGLLRNHPSGRSPFNNLWLFLWFYPTQQSVISSAKWQPRLRKKWKPVVWLLKCSSKTQRWWWLQHTCLSCQRKGSPSTWVRMPSIHLLGFSARSPFGADGQSRSPQQARRTTRCGAACSQRSSRGAQDLPGEPSSAQKYSSMVRAPWGGLAGAAAADGSCGPGSDRLLMAAARGASSCDTHRWGRGENSFCPLLWSHD